MAQTLADLREARTKSEAVIVSFSGGKDSLAVLDMCKRTFDHVECFFMYLIPGLRCVEDQLERASRRWGVKIRQYPHWLTFDLLRDGIYCFNHFTFDGFPRVKLRDIQLLAMKESGIPLLAMGAKQSDSQWRRRNLSQTKHHGILYPIVSWSKADVLGYCKANRIPIPTTSEGNATGVDLSTPSVLWLHDNYPDDYRRLVEVFPLAEAIVWRRKFYA